MTEQERWECVVRWLNALYRAYANGEPFPEKRIGNDMIWHADCEPYSAEETSAKTPNYFPCTVCPYSQKCRERTICPQQNFRILEQFTGERTVVGGILDVGL